MNISLTQQLEELVQRKVTTGRYNSASEVIREALRLLEERDQIKDLQLQALRKEISKGIRQADKGDLVSGEQAFEKLRKRNKSSQKNKK
jgi:antitoxin ParD1/3/4